jgi:hypothetical protein
LGLYDTELKRCAFDIKKVYQALRLKAVEISSKKQKDNPENASKVNVVLNNVTV